MYFTTEKDGAVKTIVCAVSGKRFDYVRTSNGARIRAEQAAVEFQTNLIKSLAQQADLNADFYTFPELEYAYEKFRRASANSN